MGLGEPGSVNGGSQDETSTSVGPQRGPFRRRMKYGVTMYFNVTKVSFGRKITVHHEIIPDRRITVKSEGSLKICPMW
jgi:hypothetical protein